MWAWPWLLLPLVCGLTVIPLPAYGSNRTERGVVWPLVKGSVWTYAGIVEWAELGAADVHTTPVTWNMEVVDVIETPGLTAATLKGHPKDLAWYKPGKDRGDYLLMRVGASGTERYYLLEGQQRVEQARAQLRAGQRIGLVSEQELILDWPLIPGKTFGETEQLTRDDLWYVWVVEEERSLAPNERRFRGADQLPTSLLCYHLAFRTFPDHQFVDVVPGLGITRYVYGHHGTVSNVDVHLVAYHPGMAGAGEDEYNTWRGVIAR